MNYSKYDASRYLPNTSEAITQGLRTLNSISVFFDINDKLQNVLEIGCASGSFLKVLKENGIKAVKGIDVDNELVKHGQNVLGVNITVSDWSSYVSQCVEKYDVIIALDVIEHINPSEIQDLIMNTNKILKPNGKLILRMPNPDCPFVLPTYFGDLTHKTLMTPDLFKYVLTEANFNGQIIFKETIPQNTMKKIIYIFLHYLFVKPLISALHFHFYGKLPKYITRNVYCCAVVS
ncbi:MAG: class I SAM-dependent methyltransferase [Bacteroidota bacterium]